jgi:enoyl-CoA hydratase
LTDLVLSERRGPVALLTLNRPDVRNALSRDLLETLGDRIAEIAADSSVRAVVVTGAGKAFAAGADIAAMREMTAIEGEAFSRLGHRVLASLEELSVPVIAAVNGFALGGGCEIACACDWVYATRRARFGQPEVNLGLIPGFGGTSRLPRRVGVAWAREMVMTGELIEAEVAERIGLVNRVFEEVDEMLEAAVKAGETVAAKGPLAVAQAKRLLQETPDADLRVAHACEQSAFGAIFATEDREEGMAAFLEKRDPQFRGR